MMHRLPGPGAGGGPLAEKARATDARVRVGRITFRLVQALQGAWLTPPIARLALLRLAGVTMHPTATVGRGVTLMGPRLTLGAHAKVGPESFIWSDTPVVLEDGARLGPRVEIVTVSHLIGSAERRSGVEVRRRLTIGRGAWIGQGALIAADVAPGCVVRIGAVVTRPTEPNGLYEGNPAELIRRLDVAGGRA